MNSQARRAILLVKAADFVEAADFLGIPLAGLRERERSHMDEGYFKGTPNPDERFPPNSTNNQRPIQLITT